MEHLSWLLVPLSSVPAQVLRRQSSDVGHDCELCYWAKVFEGTIKHERSLRHQLHERLLNQIVHPHRSCELCDHSGSESDSSEEIQGQDVEERREREMVRNTAAGAKSQLQDIHEMRLVAGMVHWLWEAEVQGTGWV